MGGHAQVRSRHASERRGNSVARRLPACSAASACRARPGSPFTQLRTFGDGAEWRLLSRRDPVQEVVLHVASILQRPSASFRPTSTRAVTRASVASDSNAASEDTSTDASLRGADRREIGRALIAPLRPERVSEREEHDRADEHRSDDASIINDARPRSSRANGNSTASRQIIRSDAAGLPDRSTHTRNEAATPDASSSSGACTPRQSEQRGGHCLCFFELGVGDADRPGVFYSALFRVGVRRRGRRRDDRDAKPVLPRRRPRPGPKA